MNIKVMIVPKDTLQGIGRSFTSEEVTIYAYSREEAMKAYSKAERLFYEWYGKECQSAMSKVIDALSGHVIHKI